MTQVIIFTNAAGGVSVCSPTGAIPIETVLTRDCPAGAIIVDNATLPTGNDAVFFDAWMLNGTTVSVNIVKAQAFYLAQYNAAAIAAAVIRQNNTLTGIPNAVSDAMWLANCVTDRAAIASATTTAQLLAINLPTP
ncbi:hypothetical protein [Methylomonas sp. AM2-LC]|uniref:hypothetical protein n=1 Tax=Methylomonas sp. AM2-LC TaxID=3153301 RepID=UPI003266306E